MPETVDLTAAPENPVAQLRADNPGKLVISVVRIGGATQYIIANAGTTIGQVIERLEANESLARYTKFLNANPVTVGGAVTPATELSDGDILTLSQKIDAGK